ncbi:MAG: MFS transporter [Parvibaculaceae bacterium]|nr:MFS transporter [Parvibaculaceae bacterium]
MTQILQDPVEPSVLRFRDFQLYLTSRLFVTFATMIQSVAVGWHVYGITNDPLSLGYVGLAQFLPMVLLTLPAGDVADRFDRRLIFAAATALELLSSLLLITLAVLNPASALPFYGVLAIYGMARAFAAPAMQSFLPTLVPAEHLPRAIALSASVFQVAVIAGPALGGALYIFGPLAAYGASAALFALGIAATLLIKPRPRHQNPSDAASTAFERVMAGIGYVRHNPVVLGALSLDLFAVLLGGATALLPVFARDILHVGPEGLGMLRSAVAAGAFVTSVALGYLSLSRKAGLLMFGAVAIFGLATILFGLSVNFYLSLFALFILGASDMISVYVRSSLIQLATPDEMRGRVSAVNFLFIGASNELGEFESGTTAGWFGTVPAVIIGGVGTLVVVGLWMWGFPALRKVDRLSDVKPG